MIEVEICTHQFLVLRTALYMTSDDMKSDLANAVILLAVMLKSGGLINELLYASEQHCSFLDCKNINLSVILCFDF